MENLSIGVLIPSSSIFPMGKKFEKGLKNALKRDSTLDFEVIPEFIGQGGLKEVETTINKLLNYHDVDVITGILPNKIVSLTANKLLGKKAIFLPNNLGENLINLNDINENVLLNSNHIWQQIWSLGYWAAENIGKKGMIVGAIYDVGYCYPAMLDLGMKAADEESNWTISVCPMPEDGGLSDPEIVLDYIEKDMPDYVFPVFCGEESTNFLNSFIRRGLHEKIKLVGTPFLLESFSEKVEEPITIYTTIQSTTALNQSVLAENWSTPFGIFEQMGDETGEIVSEMARQGNLKGVKTISSTSSRGDLYIDPNLNSDYSKIYLVENRYHGNKEDMQRTLLKELKTTTLADDSINALANELDACWMNPYLGV